VLDLAAGTGLLSRMLVPWVGSVVAVEPSEAMRRVLVQQVPAAEVVAGEAERLPLADGSVDAVVVGQAFHWFHGEAALDEMARALRPHRGIALLWNVPVAKDPRWPEELDELVERHRAAAVSDDRRYSSDHWRRAFESGGPFEPLSSGSAEHVQHLARDGVVAQIASWSYIASLPDPERQAVLDLARDTIPESTAITFRTDFYWTRTR
jgi:ubiquinone/menaquinone biosynthesis C-methylase UbiE